MTATILIIDDDVDLCRRLQGYFAKFDLELVIANKPSDGMVKLNEINPDILLLDVMLPETDGFTLCQKIRQTHHLPIIMLTARGMLSERVFGLENGADDYLAKPFEPRELVARIQVLLRRGSMPPAVDEVLQYQGLEIHPGSHRVTVDDEEVSLTGMEFKVLSLLAANPGTVFNRDALISELKGIDTKLYSRSIDILMSRLRVKLSDDPKQVRFIKTIRNAGYTFIAKRL